jgi:hypothetical protein
MIRKLTDADRQTTLDFLLEEPEINLFAIGDIEQYGFETTFQALWGDFEPDTDRLQAVLLRYETNYIPYFKDPRYNPAVFANLILSDTDFRLLSGRQSLVQTTQAAITQAARDLGHPEPTFTEKSTYFCKLGAASHLPADTTSVNLPAPQVAAPDDAPRILSLLRGIEEFSDTLTTTEARLRENIASGASRIYFIEDADHNLLTVAQTTAENSLSAMIVGVATHPDHRGRGLMSANLCALCRDLLAEGKTLCLFYDNPAAGAIYHRLGFETIDQWLMLIRR